MDVRGTLRASLFIGPLHTTLSLSMRPTGLKADKNPILAHDDDTIQYPPWEVRIPRRHVDGVVADWSTLATMTGL